MPVALRTRSWEDHVTPHSRKQYSYDDLDLVCCHASVGGSGSPTGRRRRERCASMPECCRHLPGFESCPGEDRNRRRKTLSGTFKGIAASYEGKNSQKFTKGHTFVTVRKAMADEDIIQSKDSPSSHNHSAPISNHFLYESLDEIHKKDEEISSETMSTSSGSCSANASEEQAKELDFSTTAETKNICKDNAKINFSEIIPSNEMTMELTGKSETNSEPIAEGNIGDPVVEASILHCQQVLRVGVEATVTVNDKFDLEASLVPDEHSDAIKSAGLTTEIKESETSQIPQNDVVPDVIFNSNIPNSNNDQVVTHEEVLQVHNLNASTKFEFSPCVSGSTSNPDKCRDCHSKLDTIPEVTFTEFRKEAVGPVMKDMYGSHITTLVDLKGAGNTKGSSEQLEIQKDIPEAEFLGNFQNNIMGISPDCESSLERRMEASDHVMILQKSANIDEVERDPKPQDVPVRLRTRKSSREDKERERSQLDSMVLLIMKLDQLDQEIEDALGSAPSPKDTPTAKRRFVSEVDLASLDGDGSLSGSLRSLNTPHHQSSSSLCSVKTRTSAALSEKDRADPLGGGARTLTQEDFVPSAGSRIDGFPVGARAECGFLSLLTLHDRISVFGTVRELRRNAGLVKKWWFCYLTDCARDPKMILTQIEAKEACTWLRAAGFPQYAQLYEDGQFPIQISSVTRDHDFLDRDAIEALCRRLNTLNKCAMMRLEITPQRKRSEDSDEDEPCAISGRWTFQRDSKRWSRLDQLDLDVFTSPVGDAISAPTFLSSQDQHLPGGHLLRERVSASAESVLTDLSEQPEVGSLHSAGSGGHGGSRSVTVPSSPANTNSNVATASTTRASSVASVCSSGTSGANEDSLSEGIPSPLEHGTFAFDARTFSGSSRDSKSTRSRAKSFLKRMESLRLRSSSMSSKRKKKGAVSNGRLEISGPVLKEGLDEDKLRQLNCVDIATLEHTGTHNHSTSYSTQTSSGSTGSSHSETSSGSAVSTPSPITRARSHSTAAGSIKRVGMYLEGFDPFSLVQENENLEIRNCGIRPEPSMTTENNLRNRKSTDERQVEHKRIDEETGVIYFYLPDGHKPGTFPKSLADGGSFHRSDSRPHRRSSTSLDSRLSFYDNVPFPEIGDEEEDEPEGEEEEPKIEDVLERVTGLQRLVSAWTESGPGEEEEEEEEGDSDSALDSASPCPSSPLQNHLMETENGSDQESTGNPGEQDDTVSARERRDSGVGASLTRANRPQKLRWPSFQNSHRPSVSSSALQLDCQSVLQMNLLQKYSLLKLTALLEKHTPTNKHGFSWAVPKFMKRMKVRDSKERSVFGVPLQVNVQRSGQPLPQGIQQAMRYLRNHGLDQVGLFRKSGVKSRIQALRQMNESCGTEGGGVSYEGQSAYDVADMLKQYFRDLPEPLLTSKLSDTFLQIYQFIPVEQRLQAVRAAVCLLPDESRDALHTLLCFLSDVAANVSENQMTCTNLAVCLAPSLFHLNTARRDASSPRVMSRKNPLGKPDQRDLNENLAATHGLTHMIQECRKLFQIPEELSRCRNSYIEQALIPPRMEDLQDDSHSYRSLVKESMDALLKEAKEKFRGYDTCSTPEHAELAYKKVNDGWSLRQWKVCVDVAAGADEVLQRIVREQERWDEDLLESRVIETLDSNTDIYQYIRNNMAPNPATDYVVLRSWVTDLPKGACACVCVSVEHEAAPVLGVRANVVASRYLIEPSGPNKSRVTHISRIDHRGRCPEWYNKLYGHLCVSELVRLRDSFTCPLDK